MKKQGKIKIIGLALAVSVGLLIVTSVAVFLWQSGQNAAAPGVSATESPVGTTAVDWPPCLTLVKSSGNTVCGYIVNEKDGTPVIGRPVFLARALFSADKSMVLASLDQTMAPKGVTDERGMFCIVDVPADMYFLLLGDYPQPMMLRDPKNPAYDLTVDWRESEGAVDVGVIPVQIVVPILP